MTATTVLYIVAMVVSLIMSTGTGINSATAAGRNAKLRNTINKFSSVINEQISKGRLALNKIISLLASKNNHALMTYLQHNPVVSRSIESIQADSALISDLQAEQSALEAEITSLQNELNSLGYNQGWTSKSSKEEQNRYINTSKKLDDAQNRYKKLADKAANVNVSTAEAVHAYTSDIDAYSQNINGGYKNV